MSQMLSPRARAPPATAGQTDRTARLLAVRSTLLTACPRYAPHCPWPAHPRCLVRSRRWHRRCRNCSARPRPLQDRPCGLSSAYPPHPPDAQCCPRRCRRVNPRPWCGWYGDSFIRLILFLSVTDFTIPSFLSEPNPAQFRPAVGHFRY